MKQYEMFELTFLGEEPEESEVKIDLQAEFTTETEKIAVPGFYAGNGVYKIRFYPREAGNVSWKVTGLPKQCSAMAEGQEICELASEHSKGIVRAKGLHFFHDNGKNYKPFGTTIYGMISQEMDLIDTTMETLKGNAFNKVRFCVFPKHYDFNHNEPVYYAFRNIDGKWDVNHPDYGFWEHLEKRIMQLDQLGIQGDLILFHPYDRWGFSTMSMEDNMTYLDYLLRRLSAFPNLWWSMANEYDLFPNLTIENWKTLTAFVAEHDPYHHLLSNHNCFNYWDFTQENITHCCIQDINMNEVPELQEKYKKPIVFDECRYEGNIMHSWGNLSGRELVHRFWTATAYGGYCTHGETFYSEDEVLWWAKGGVLKGESPARIKFLRDIAESIPGPLTFVREGVGALTVEMIEEMKEHGVPAEWKGDFFAEHMIHLPKERMQFFLLRHRAALSHYEKEAYLRYYEKECTSVGEMILPEDGTYTVEVIDTYEMTRAVVARGVSGKVTYQLPGKEGIAVLARKE